MIYLGSYAGGDARGIGVAALRDGVLALDSTVECPARPAFLAAPDGRALYAVHELEDGLISGFAIGEDGSLRPRGTQPSAGAEPCHLSVHPSGRYVLALDEPTEAREDRAGHQAGDHGRSSSGPQGSAAFHASRLLQPIGTIALSWYRTEGGRG